MLLTSKYKLNEHDAAYDTILNFISTLSKLIEQYGKLQIAELNIETPLAQLAILQYEKNRNVFNNMKDILETEYTNIKDKILLNTKERQKFEIIKKKLMSTYENYIKYFNECERIYNLYKHIK